MEVQLSVDVGPRRVAEALGLPQRSQRIDDLAAGVFGQHATEGHGDERDAAGGSHRCGGQLRRLAHHQVGSDPIDDRRQVLAHHRGGRPSEHRGEQRPAAFFHRQLHQPIQPRSDRVAFRRRQAGGGPLEPHRPDGTATIGGDRPVHVVATIPQCPSDRRQGVHVPGAARTRAQHPQPTLHRTSVHPRPPPVGPTGCPRTRDVVRDVTRGSIGRMNLCPLRIPRRVRERGDVRAWGGRLIDRQQCRTTSRSEGVAEGVKRACGAWKGRVTPVNIGHCVKMRAGSCTLGDDALSSNPQRVPHDPSPAIPRRGISVIKQVSSEEQSSKSEAMNAGVPS